MFEFSTTPQPVGRLLDQGFQLFSQRFKDIWLASLVYALLASSVNLIIPSNFDPITQANWWTDPAIADLLMYVPLYIIALFYCANVLMYRLGANLFEQPDDWGSVVYYSLKMLLPMVLAGLFYIFFVMIGVMAFILPGLVLSLSLFFYMPAVLFEQKSSLQSLGYSYRLVKQNWWRIATLISVPAALFLLTSLVLAFLIGGTSWFDDSIDTSVNGFFLDTVINIIFTPLFYAVTLVAYNDLKLRHEGADLQKRLIA